MVMSVADLRTFVTTHLDTDSTELPDDLLDSYLVEGVNRIALSSQRWSFYEATWSLSTVADQQAYDLSTLVGSGGEVVGEVTAVQGPRWRLEPRTHELMSERFEYTTERGEPRFWSVWGGSLFLWPVPLQVYALSVRGYRKPSTVLSDGAYPDLPAEFHPLVGQWMLGRAYQQQDDVVTSPMLFQQFERELSVLRPRYETVSRATTRTLGGVKRSGQGRVNGRLLFPWE